MTSTKNPTNFSGGSVKEKIQFIILAFLFMLCGIIILTISLPELTFKGLFHDDLTIGGLFLILFGYGIIFMFNVIKTTNKTGETK